MDKNGVTGFLGKDYFKRTKTQFLLALFPCGLFSFMYFFFGPTELVYQNQKSLVVGIFDSTPFFLFSFALITILLSLGISLCNSSIFSALTKLLLGLSLASYVQANFMNDDFNYLDGRSVSWHLYAKKATLNILVWAVIIAAVYLSAMLLKSRWTKVCCALSALLIFMQLAGLVSLYIDSVKTQPGSDIDTYSFSLAEQYDISANDNVIIFLLDACSNRTVEDMTARYGDALDSFTDFTYFDNCAPSFYGTFPEMVVMLTGNDQYDTTKSWQDFVSASWESEEACEFYDLLADNNYDRNFFDDVSFISNKYSLLEGKIDNAQSFREVHQIDAVNLYTKLGKLSLYRYLPIAMKACYWSSDLDYSDIVKEERWDCVESNWFSRISKNGLNVKDENVFSLYHFWGAHSPYLNNEYGEYVGVHEDRSMQLRGTFYIISEYMQMLKDMDLYDSSTIVILGDHGDYAFTGSEASTSSVFMIKRKNESHSTMAVSSAPITHLELLPTIAAEVAPTHSLGETVYSIDENASRDRTIYRWFKRSSLSPGNYDCFYKFTVPANINDLNDLSTPEEILPLADSFY